MTPPLPAGWTWLDLPDGRQAIWSLRTGRHLPVGPALLPRLAHPESLPPVLHDRLDDLGPPHTDLSTRVVCRSAWALVLPERQQLWHADPSRWTAGGASWRSTPLSADTTRLLAAVDQHRTVSQLARMLGLPTDTVLTLLAPFQTPHHQAIQLRRKAPHPRDRSLHHLVRPPRPDGPRRPDQHDARGATTLGAWHEDGITDARTHFDNVETTFAHAFAEPHPALKGMRYGARLHQQLVQRGLLKPHATVLEVGPGTGQLARHLLDADQAQPHIRRYIRLDRSPVLLAAQNARVPESEGIQGDATDLPFPPASVDLVLSNEVLADLSAVPWSPGQAGPVGERIDRYGLHILPGSGPYNLGAWQLVESAAKVLKPGGAMVLTEFGAVDERPTETRHLDHPEVSIHFGHLAHVARGCGLEASLEPVHDLLQVDLHQKWLSRASMEGLRALHHADGGHLEARAWTAATVPTPTPVVGLTDVPITEDGAAPVITRLYALVAHRPR